MTFAQTEYLLGIPKFLTDSNGKPLNRLTLAAPATFDIRLDVISDEEHGLNFLWIARQSQKSWKFTLHFQDNDSFIPLLRIDYRGRHKNPEVVNSNVPEDLKPFAGQYLDDYPAHIHYNIEGYKPLVWAKPLLLDDFPVKELESDADIVEAFIAFGRKINLQTTLHLHYQMKLV